MLLYSIDFGQRGRAKTTLINVMYKKKNTHRANYVSVSKMEFLQIARMYIWSAWFILTINFIKANKLKTNKKIFKSFIQENIHIIVLMKDDAVEYFNTLTRTSRH